MSIEKRGDFTEGCQCPSGQNNRPISTRGEEATAGWNAQSVIWQEAQDQQWNSQFSGMIAHQHINRNICKTSHWHEVLFCSWFSERCRESEAENTSRSSAGFFFFFVSLSRQQAYVYMVWNCLRTFFTFPPVEGNVAFLSESANPDFNWWHYSDTFQVPCFIII